MNNSNNFNVCEKCGTANPIVAKFCYQCGGQLRTPEDPIVCPKCNTVNSGSARFCKFCGTKLFRGNSIKVCPRCNHTVAGDAIKCDKCNFEFLNTSVGTTQFVQPTSVAQIAYQEAVQFSPSTAYGLQQQSAENMQTAAAEVTQENETPKKKNKSVFGSFIMFLLLSVFVYFCIGYDKIFIPQLQNFGLYNYTKGAYDTGIGILYRMFLFYKQGTLFQQIPAYYILSVYIALTLLTAVICWLVSLVRMLIGKRAKRCNWWYLIMFVLTGLITAAFVVAGMNNAVATFCKNILFRSTTVPDGFAVAMLMYIVPIFFFVAWLLSICFKATKKQEILEITR